METQQIFPESADKNFSQNFKMIDIGPKQDTHRRAVASGLFCANESTIARIRDRSLPKGDVLVLAEVAGIQGAKNTSALLPLCHPLSLTGVRVWSEVHSHSIRVYCEAKTFGKTGVEMEALCGVNAALLCIYDLTKGIDPVLEIKNVALEIKEGGKSGVWINPNSAHAAKWISKPMCGVEVEYLSTIVASVITLSDSCFNQQAKDASGPAAVKWLGEHGAVVKNTFILPDDSKKISLSLNQLLESKNSQLIITTGGTGLSKRDVTPETVRAVCRELGGQEIEGLGELLRKSGEQYTKQAWLSRSAAFLIHGALVVCLPGSPKAVLQGLEAIGPLVQHALHTHQGGGHSV